MPFLPNDAPFRTDAFHVFDPATDTPAFDPNPPEAPEKDRPAFWTQTVPAAFRLDNSVASFLSSNAPVLFQDQWDKNYDVFNDIAGYEDYADKLAVARNKTHADQIKADIDAENNARQVLSSSGGLGVAAGLAAGILSPESLLPMGEVATGVKGGYNLLKVAGRSMAAGALGASVYEANLHASQQTRTMSESALNVGAATLLSGVLGAGAAAWLGRAGVDGLAPKVTRDMNVPAEADGIDAVGDALQASLVPSESTAGAMQVPKLSMDQESLKSALGAVSATEKLNISPAVRLMSSPSVETRQVFQQLAENPLFINKNAEGIASEQAVETLTKEYHGDLAKSTNALNQQYSAYRKATKGADSRLSFEQFKEQVAFAMRRGDVSDIPQVEAAAKAYRPTFERMKNEAIGVDLLPPDVEPRFAVSYLSRLWDRNKILLQEQDFRNTIRDWARTKAEASLAGAKRGLDRTLNSLRREAADLKGKVEAASVKRLEEVNKRIDDLESSGRVDIDTHFDVQNDMETYLDEVVDNIYNALTGRDSVKLPRDFVVSQRGPLREKTLDIPDVQVERFLNNDIDLIARKHVRTVGTDVELKRKFGDITMKDQIKQIKESYDKLRKQAAEGGEKQASALKTIKAKIEQVISTATKNGNEHLRAEVGKVSDWLAKAAKKAGLDIEGFTHTLDTSAIRHVRKKHGDTASEAARGQIAITDDDMKLIPDIVSSPDKVYFGTKNVQGKDQIIYMKKMNDGTVIYLDEVRTGARELATTSMRKYPAATRASSIEKTLGLNVQNDGGTSTIIAEAPKEINNSDIASQIKGLSKREKSDIEDLETMRDVIRGTYDDGTGAGWKRVSRMARAWNYVTKMGMVVPSSFADVARPVMVHGFGRVFGDLLIPMMRGLKGIKMQAAEGKLAGHIVETVLSSRMMEMSDLADPYAAGTAFERFVHNSMVPSFSKLTLMNQWNDVIKTAASGLTQTRILENIEAASVGKLSTKEREYMAFLGIDRDTMRNIAAEYKEHGQIVDGVRVANTANWQNREAVRAFRAALNKEVDSILVQPGVADKPLLMNKEWGKVVFQFRTFFFASNQRVMMRALQQRDAAALQGAVTSLAFGMLSAYVGAVGRQDDPSQWSEEKWIYEGLDKSGIVPVMFELNNTAEKLMPGVYKAAGFQQSSRYLSRTETEALLGPTLGLSQSIEQMTRNLSDGQVKKNDIRALRRLMPYQNLFYLRGVFDKLEDAADNALGATQ